VGVTIDSILIRDKTLPATDLDGRVVVLSVYAGAYVSFNGVASEIWHMLSEPRRVGDIFDALSQSHDVDETELSHDVLPFLQKLIERKLARLLHQDGAR
jgi:ActR/RegA family two-component response regulator